MTRHVNSMFAALRTLDPEGPHSSICRSQTEPRNGRKTLSPEDELILMRILDMPREVPDPDPHHGGERLLLPVQRARRRQNMVVGLAAAVVVAVVTTTVWLSTSHAPPSSRSSVGGSLAVGSGPHATGPVAVKWRLTASLSGPQYQVSTNNPDGVIGVGCSGTPTCFLSTGYGPGYGTGGLEGVGGPTYVSHDNGLSWQPTILPPDVNINTQVACVNSNWCAAGAGLLDHKTGDPEAKKPSKDPEFAFTTNGGGSWTVTAVPIPVFVDQIPANGDLAAETTYWPGEVDALSCSAPGSCSVIGQTMTSAPNGGIGDEFVFFHTSDAGSTWSSSVLPELPTELSYQANPWSASISCTDTDDCVVIGTLYPFPGLQVGDVNTWRTTDGGNYWAETQVSGVSGTLPARSIGCLSDDNCWAGPTQGSGRPSGALLHSVDGGTHWSLVALPDADPVGSAFASTWSSASCVSDTACFIGGSTGIDETTDGGTRWQPVALPPSVGTVLQISCNASDTCVALANPVPSGNGSLISDGLGSLILTDGVA